MLKKDELKGVFEVPEAKKIRTDELEETQIAGGSMGEAVDSGVASGVSCGIVTVMIPGPGIPG